MKITVYGPGCKRCEQLAGNVTEAVKQSGMEVEVEKITAVADIARAGVLFTPGLAIDGKMKSTGRVPEVAEIVQWIRAGTEN